VEVFVEPAGSRLCFKLYVLLYESRVIFSCNRLGKIVWLNESRVCLICKYSLLYLRNVVRQPRKGTDIHVYILCVFISSGRKLVVAYC
jgi:hypothetical protein